MSDDELYEAIGQSRNNRRAPSEQVTRKTRTSKKAKTPKQPKDLFSSLSPEAAAELLKKLNLNG